MKRKKISIVISAYNEEGNIAALYAALCDAVLTLTEKEIEFIFVDDGSSDKTFDICRQIQEKDSRIRIIRLVRNFGHEIAMTAGLDYAQGDAVIFMDADLQHPPHFIKQMVSLWEEGNEIVLMRRKDNVDTGWIYRFCARIFYRVLNYLSDTKIPEKMPDFRLIDKKYADFLKTFNEQDRLFRGMLSWALPTSKTVILDFTAPHRLSGKSKYTFLKSLKLAMTSILQFSVKPLYFSLWLAIIFIFLALGLGVYVIIEHFILKNPTPGYATIMATIVLMGSMNLLMFAIQGAYIAKIHVECKKRPLYLAELIEKKDKQEKG